MKTINNFIMVAALIIAPAAKAQWNAVRFDHLNTFQKVYNVDANNAFVLGNESSNYECFFLRTSNGGATWDSIGLNTPNTLYQLNELFFVDVNTGFIGGMKNSSTQVLLKTTDNGTTWNDVTPSPGSPNPLSAVFFVSTSIGYATAGSTFYATTDGGVTWTSNALSFIPLDLNFTSVTEGFACGTSGGNPAVNMKTTDGGVTWTSSLVVNAPMLFVPACELLNVIDANTAFTSLQYTNKLFRTVNGGASWDTIVCDSVFSVIDFHFNSADSGYVLSDDGRLFYTSDAGATWAMQYATEWGFYGPSIYLYSLSFADGVGYMCGSNGLIKRYDEAVAGVHEAVLQTQVSVTVFPNPCYGSQNISLMVPGMSGECLVTITDLSGRTVHEQFVFATEGSPIVFRGALNLPDGVYSVRISGDNQSGTAQFVVNE